MTNTDIDDIAGRLVAAHREGPLLDAVLERAPASAADAYRIHDRVLGALAPGVRPWAWKVVPPQPGAELVASPVPPDAVLQSPAVVSARGRRLLGVEAEIAFRIGRDLEARSQGYSARDAVEAVSEAFVLIELCATRLANWKDAAALWKLADFQFNGCFVLGSGAANWPAIRFETQAVELLVNGECKARAAGSHPSGNPASLLPWALSHCAARGGLRVGDVITMGSWTGLTPVSAPAEVLVRFPGIGEARLQLA